MTGGSDKNMQQNYIKNTTLLTILGILIVSGIEGINLDNDSERF